MAVDVHAEVLIERPREVVGEFMFNPKCDKIWMTNVTKVFPLSPGNLKKGSKVEHIGSFLGRYFSRNSLVIRDEENALLEMVGDEPFPMKIRYDLKDAESGTNVKIRIQSTEEINIPSPVVIISRSVLEWIESDLKRLKKHLEENVEAD